MILVIVLRIGELQLLPLRARARALHAHEETTLKYRRFPLLGSAQRTEKMVAVRSVGGSSADIVNL